MENGARVYVVSRKAQTCDAVAAALTRLLEDRELRLDLAARGRETYLQRAAPEAVGRDLLAVLSDRYGC